MLTKVLLTGATAENIKLGIDLLKGTAEQALQAQFNQWPELRQNPDLLRAFLSKPSNMTVDQLRLITQYNFTTAPEIKRAADIIQQFPDSY